MWTAPRLEQVMRTALPLTPARGGQNATYGDDRENARRTVVWRGQLHAFKHADSSTQPSQTEGGQIIWTAPRLEQVMQTALPLTPARGGRKGEEGLQLYSIGQGTDVWRSRPTARHQLLDEAQRTREGATYQASIPTRLCGTNVMKMGR